MGGFAMRVGLEPDYAQQQSGYGEWTGLWCGPVDRHGRVAPVTSAVACQPKPRVRVKAWRRPNEDGAQGDVEYWRARKLARFMERG